MNNLQIEIISAEKTYLDRLESFFNSIYPPDDRISHGLDHHRRVWAYAKELVLCMNGDGMIFDRTFIQKLITACYLHDIGMAVNTGERHGCHSRELCIRFLRENDMNESGYSDLLSAIENHDDKEYTGDKNKDTLLTILSVADDLDAFGKEGILRYLEIYRERGIDEKKLGQTICDNAGRRYRNFESNFLNHPELVEKHRIRYLELIAHITDNYNSK